MNSTKYFLDEKFKDTIKKNSCRLRQKSSIQINVLKNAEPKEQHNNNENKEYFNKMKTIEKIKTPKNRKLLNFIKSKKYKELEGKKKEEDNQTNLKKKQNEQNSISIKKWLLKKLKEQRTDKLNKIVNNEIDETNNEINSTIKTKEIPEDALYNKKKLIGLNDIKNIIYRNNKNCKNVSCSIKKEENKESNYLNTMTNTMKTYFRKY